MAIPNVRKPNTTSHNKSGASWRWVGMAAMIILLMCLAGASLSGSQRRGAVTRQDGDRYTVLNEHVDPQLDMANPPDLLFVDGTEFILSDEERPIALKDAVAAANRRSGDLMEKTQQFCSSPEVHTFIESVIASGFRGSIVVMVADLGADGIQLGPCSALASMATNATSISFHQAKLPASQQPMLSMPSLQAYRAISSYFGREGSSSSILQTRFAKAALVRPFQVLWCGQPFKDVIGHMKSVSMFGKEIEDAPLQQDGMQPDATVVTKAVRRRWWNRSPKVKRVLVGGEIQEQAVASTTTIFIDDFVGSSVVGLHRYVKTILSLAANASLTTIRGEALSASYVTNIVSSIIKGYPSTTPNEAALASLHKHLRPLHANAADGHDAYIIVSAPSECSSYRAAPSAPPRCPSPRAQEHRPPQGKGRGQANLQSSLRLVSRLSNCHGLVD